MRGGRGSRRVRPMSILLLTSLIAAPAHAEDAPEFLLGDLGVRIDLPRSWRMTRWSDWDFNAELKRGRDTVLLFAWATPVQTAATAGSRLLAWFRIEITGPSSCKTWRTVSQPTHSSRKYSLKMMRRTKMNIRTKSLFCVSAGSCIVTCPFLLSRISSRQCLIRDLVPIPSA